MEERVIGRLRRFDEGSIGWCCCWEEGEDWSWWPVGVDSSCRQSISVIFKRIEGIQLEVFKYIVDRWKIQKSDGRGEINLYARSSRSFSVWRSSRKGPKDQDFCRSISSRIWNPSKHIFWPIVFAGRETNGRIDDNKPDTFSGMTRSH